MTESFVVFFFFFVLSARLSVLDKLKQQHADSVLTLYCASRNKKSIQADLQPWKNVHTFSVFGMLKAALNCFRNLCKSLLT